MIAGPRGRWHDHILHVALSARVVLARVDELECRRGEEDVILGIEIAERLFVGRLACLLQLRLKEGARNRSGEAGAHRHVAKAGVIAELLVELDELIDVLLLSWLALQVRVRVEPEDERRGCVLLDNCVYRCERGKRRQTVGIAVEACEDDRTASALIDGRDDEEVAGAERSTTLGHLREHLGRQVAQRSGVEAALGQAHERVLVGLARGLGHSDHVLGLEGGGQRLLHHRGAHLLQEEHVRLRVRRLQDLDLLRLLS